MRMMQEDGAGYWSCAMAAWGVVLATVSAGGTKMQLAPNMPEEERALPHRDTNWAGGGRWPHQAATHRGGPPAAPCHG